jgi:hypothetical protein
MTTNFRFNNGGTITDFSDAFIRRDIFSKGGLFTWGSAGAGQLGDNTRTAKSSPVQTVASGTSWKQISGSGYYGGNMAGIKTDGTLWIWGTYIALGDNGVYGGVSSPIQTVAGGSNWKQVSTSNDVTGAIKTDGTLWMWGRNAEGALGDNTSANKSSPVQTVSGSAIWKQVSANTVVGAIKTDGTLWMWGDNFYGQLGDNTRTLRSSPIQTVSGGTNWKQISTNGSNAGAVKTDGTLWMWGLNTSGQLGDNTRTNTSSPIQTVAGGSNWKQVYAGGSTTAAIKTDGTLWLWGSNTGFGPGQLGDGTILAKSSPVQTVAGGTNWKQVSGNYAMAAIKTDGTLWTWGDNSNGQLGDGTTSHKSSPIQTLAGGTDWKQVTMEGYAGAITDIFGDGSAPTDGGPAVYLPGTVSLVSTYGNVGGSDAQAWTELIFKTDGRMTIEEANSSAAAVQETVSGSWLSSSPRIVSTAIAGNYDIELTPDSHTLSIDGVNTVNELSGTSRSTNSTGTSWNTRLQLGTTNLSRFLVSSVTSGDGSSYVESAYINFTATIYYHATNVIVSNSQVSFSTEASTGPPV